MTQTITTTAATTHKAARPAKGRRVANVALWVLQVALAALFVFAALPKLTANQQAVDGFNAMGLGTTGMYIVGALELAGAIALLIPVLSGLAGASFVALMIGAVIATVLTFGADATVAMPAAVLVLVAVVAWARRGRNAELVALVRRYTHR